MGSGAVPKEVALLGEVLDRQLPPIVDLPSNAFGQLPGTFPVAEPAVYDQQFTDNPTRHVLEHFSEGDLKVELVSIRFFAPLVPPLIPVAMQQPSFTPREAWLTIGVAARTLITMDEHRAAFRPLMDWLRVIASLTELGTYPTVMELPALVYPRDPLLEVHYTQYLGHQTPGWTLTPTSGTVQAINLLTTRMTQIEESRAQRDAANRTTTVESYYGETCQVICSFMNVKQGSDLPQLWQKLAQSPKRTQRRTLGLELQATARTLGLTAYVLRITPGLVNKLLTFDLQHNDREDLDAGLHPFLTTKAKPAELTRLKQLLKDYDTMMSGDSAPAMLDLHKFKGLDQLIFANDVSSFLYALKGMNVLLHAMFPETHAFVTAWKLMVNAVEIEQENLKELMTPLDIAMAMRWIQLRQPMWINRQRSSPAQVPVPQFEELVTLIMLSDQWHPDLPIQYAALFGHRGTGGPPPASARPLLEPSPCAALESRARTGPGRVLESAPRSRTG
jgi:hypothetical protein